jgi:hypothetical protein
MLKATDFPFKNAKAVADVIVDRQDSEFPFFFPPFFPNF